MAAMDYDEIHIVVKEAVEAAMTSHPCWMSEEDRAILRDMVQGGKYFKRSIIMTLAGLFLVAVAKAIMLVKGAG